MITLDEAIAILSEEANGCVTFNQKHREAIEYALQVMVDLKTGKI